MTQELWPASGHGLTKRARQRIGLSLKATLTVDEGREIATQLRDISTIGFAAHSIDALAPGTRVLVQLPDIDPVPAEIVWQIGPTMGGRFLAELSTQQIRKLAAR
jgi:hypothetical protein